MSVINIPTNYYGQFDADYSLDMPAKGFKGWEKAPLPVDTEKTALVVMHAWEAGTIEQYPGWWRCVEYLERSIEISRTTLKQLLDTAREKGMRVIHVVGWNNTYYTDLPGYKRAKELAGETAPTVYIKEDPTSRARWDYRSKHAFPGENNLDIHNLEKEGLHFDPYYIPNNDEYVCENGDQLFAVCQKEGINHLIYSGFAINFCLTFSPGGMVDLSRHGVTCSVVRQCTTAVENKESIDGELNKEYGLWLTSMMFGFIYDLPDLLKALDNWS